MMRERELLRAALVPAGLLAVFCSLVALILPAHFTIASDDRTLRYTVGAALGIIAVIYAAGEISALF